MVTQPLAEHVAIVVIISVITAVLAQKISAQIVILKSGNAKIGHVRMAIAVLAVLVARHVIVCEMVINPKQSNGFCLRPFAFYFPIQRGFSGPIQTLPFCIYLDTRGPMCI